MARIRVELNHTDPTALPSGFRLGDNDTRILAVARNLSDEGHAVTLVSKDLPLRIKASAVGLDAEEYRGDAIGDSDTGYSGMAELDVTAAELDELYDDGSLDLPAARELPCHCGLVLLSDRGTALGRVGADKQVRLVRGDREAFGIHGRSAEQRIALEMLLDPEVGIVSLGGRAGTGKSALALCAGLEAVPRAPPAQEGHRVPAAVRGGRPGARLPARLGVEKMSPWAQAVFDTLGAITSREVIDEVLDRGMLEVLPLTHIRGRSLHDAFVIVDEAQSLERNVLLTVLSRIGAGSKVVLTHDVAQRDNLRVGPPRRRGRGRGEAQGPSPVRPRHADPLRAFADRGPGDRDAGERDALNVTDGLGGSPVTNGANCYLTTWGFWVVVLPTAHDCRAWWRDRFVTRSPSGAGDGALGCNVSARRPRPARPS